MNPIARGLLGVAALLALRWAEQRWPLRPERDRGRRTLKNLSIATTAGAGVLLLEQPLALLVTRAVERRRWGLVQRLSWPRAAKTALAVALLDYTLFVWHYLTHKVLFLWRFHLVHHLDRNLDTTTALRFHFGELALAAGYRVVQLCVLGVSPGAYATWQTLTMLSVMFHHSNWRLPDRAERVLGFLVMTPRLHTIHHSDLPEQTNSNWSSGLVLWDRLHGTLSTGVAPEAVAIGVSGVERELGFFSLLVLPFRRSTKHRVLREGLAHARGR